VDTDYVEKMINNEQAFGRGLWGLLSMEIWFNTFIDGREHS
jgi:hypothetical protein